jgi:Glucosidase II beta subunit-like protein
MSLFLLNAIQSVTQRVFFYPPLVLLVASLLVENAQVAAKQQHYSQLYSSHDDYDPSILDPDTFFGSPYGGFSRATQSRLASLPLKLPDEVTSDADSPRETLYWEIADGLGRDYACRIYDQEEIEPENLNDSMFEAPGLRLYVEVQQAKHRLIGERVARVLGSTILAHDQAKKYDKEPLWPDDKDQDENEAIIEELSVDERVVDEFIVMRIERRLDVLEGVCVQKLLGFSTYELCWEGKIHKFHVNVPPKESVHQKIQLENVSVLGSYSHRKIIPNHGSSRGDESGPLGHIKQTFINGDKCQETGKQTESLVNIRCCSVDKTQSYSGAMLIRGLPIPSDKLVLASLVNVWEDPDRPCHQILDVCTPVLCAETSVYDIFEQINSLGIDEDNEPDDLQYATTAAGIPPSTIEFLSVSDLLDQILGDNCLYSSKEGWWTYE